MEIQYSKLTKVFNWKLRTIVSYLMNILSSNFSDLLFKTVKCTWSENKQGPCWASIILGFTQKSISSSLVGEISGRQASAGRERTMYPTKPLSGMGAPNWATCAATEAFCNPWVDFYKKNAFSTVRWKVQKHLRIQLYSLLTIRISAALALRIHERINEINIKLNELIEWLLYL